MPVDHHRQTLIILTLDQLLELLQHFVPSFTFVEGFTDAGSEATVCGRYDLDDAVSDYLVHFPQTRQVLQ